MPPGPAAPAYIRPVTMTLQVGSAAMETSGPSAGPSGGPPKRSEGDAAKPAGLLPEVEIYLALLVMVFLIDHQQFQQVGGFLDPSMLCIY